MKKLILAAALTAALVVGVVFAYATPGSGVSGPVVARGKVAENIVIGTPVTQTVTRTVTVKVKVRGKTYRRKAKVKVRVQAVRTVMSCSSAAPCDSAFQQITISPGGTTGWHTHPGPTWVAVASGEGTLYHSGVTGCPGHKYAAGNGFFQPGRTDDHTFRNETAAPLTIYAYYLLPANTPNTSIRTDEPQGTGCTVP